MPAYSNAPLGGTQRQAGSRLGLVHIDARLARRLELSGDAHRLASSRVVDPAPRCREQDECREDGEAPRSYLLSRDQRVLTRDALARLIAMFEEWENKHYTFRDDDRPHPIPELRVRPRV